MLLMYSLERMDVLPASDFGVRAVRRLPESLLEFRSQPSDLTTRYRVLGGQGSHRRRVEMIFIPAASPLEDGGWPEDLDTAKALFMIEVARIVEEGRGKVATLESGAVEFRPATGEIYHLGECSITRIA
jgi:hypothetical protein